MVARAPAAPRILRLTVVAICAAALASSCGGGGGGKVDSAGFTASQFNTARDVLTQLGQTAIYDAALKLSLTQAEVPTACLVHLEREQPLTFRIFMTWVPNQAALGGTVQKNAGGRSFSWLDAVIGAQGTKGDYSFHQGNERTLAELKSHYGNVFSKPVEHCLVLQNQKFGLLPAD